MNSKLYKLEEIASLITKGTTPTTLGYNFEESGIKFLKIESFDEKGNFLVDKVSYISNECHEKLKRSQLEKDDILFSIAGAIGRVAIVKDEMLPANTNQALAIIRIKKDEIYLPYIKLILNSKLVTDQFNKRKQGVAQLNLSLKDIGNLVVPIPKYEEQVKISNLFNKISLILENKQKQIALLNDLIKSRFVEIFKNKDFPITTIGELVAHKVSTAKNDFDNNDTIKYIDISSIDNKQNVMTGFTEFIMENAPSRAQQHIRKGDIVVSTVRPNLRNVAITNYEYDNLVASSGFCVLRAEKCLSSYLMAIVCSNDFTDAMTKVVTGANYPAIKDSDVKKYKVFLPPIKQQKEFETFVNLVDKSKFEIQKSIDETQKLFDSLMQEYFG